MDSKPPTPLSEQSDKTKKYDRQLRLWGDHGQALLESAHICVCGASTATQGGAGLGGSSVLGAEVLRSLVLPGVGKITVLDDALVTEADLGNNLFVSEASLGQPRGEQILQAMLEMNPDVRGSFVEQSTEELLCSQPHFFDTFSVVVAVNMHAKALLELSECLWRAKVPLLAVRSYGLVGYIRVQIQEQTIVESHPENEIPDLRLLEPFPSLKEYFDSIDLDSLDDKQHSHTPYVVVIYKFLQKWTQERGSPPKNYKDRKLLGQMIRDGMRHKSALDYEENFEEAIKALNTCLSSSGSGCCSSLEQLFSLMPSPLTPTTPPFWLALAGLQTFVETNKRLPVTGVVPDMTADSASYIRLQNIYREQAAQDAEAVLRHSQLMSAQQLGGGEGGSRDGSRGTAENRGVAGVDAKGDCSLSESLVRSICRNAAHLRVIRGTCIAHEYRDKVDLGGPDVEVCDSDVVWYVLLRAVDLFHSEFRCYPGYFAGQVETDIMRLKVCVNKLLSDWSGGSGCPGLTVKDDHIHEMCRFGAAQIHSVASFIGGCAAHEVIKLLTGQYVPVDNTFIYNAASATTLTLKL